MHDDLHWLSVPQRVQYKLAATVHRRLVVSGIGLQRISPTTACQFPQFPVVTVCDQPDVINCLYHMFSAAPLRLWHFLSPDPQFGTHCLMICVIQLWTLYNFCGTWRRTCSPDIRSISALGVFTQCTLQIDIYLLLTYLKFDFDLSNVISDIWQRCWLNISATFRENRTFSRNHGEHHKLISAYVC